ncbi:hypothetical protein P0Y35_04140 [Kiritimatiellaeota bacterium B1221]|nr:hypothetical protein [Kiritimatiellaeota bacterium B1221]
MTQSKSHGALFSFLIITLCFTLSACGAKKTSGAATLEAGIPKALLRSKLVYETAQGVHLQTPGQKSEILVEGAKWPRWRPDGKAIAFLRGEDVCVINPATKEIQILAKTQTPKTLVYSHDGSEIWFSDGKTVKAVSVTDQKERVLVQDGEFLEIDSGPESKSLVATVKSFGYKVKVYNLENDQNRSLGKGCSASFSPDGKYVTNNLDGHQALAIVNVSNGNREKSLPAPGGMLTDNQFWSNHPDWIMSMEEESGHLLAHRFSDGKVWKLSDVSGADRPDLWVP